MNNTHPMRGIE